MTDMPNGFLNFHAKPRPAHARTIERLDYWAERGFDDIPEGMRGNLEPVIVTELCFRICGCELPDGVAQDMLEAAQRLLTRMGTDESRHVLQGAISWLKRTYL